MVVARLLVACSIQIVVNEKIVWAEKIVILILFPRWMVKAHIFLTETPS